jgi:arylsulfatase A-like enzyme
MKDPLNRRDFLKLLGMFPLVSLANSNYIRGIRSRRLSSGENSPNVLVIIFDALSAQHMSLYDYPRQTTPNISKIASRATVFHRHYAGGNFTTPGTASLLTGVYPWKHRAMHFRPTVSEDYIDKQIFRLLNDTHFTIGYSHNAIPTGLMQQFHRHIDQIVPTRELCILDDRFSDEVFSNDLGLALFFEERWRGSKSRQPNSLFLSFISKLRHLLLQKPLIAKYGAMFPRGIAHNYGDQLLILEDAINWIEEQTESLPEPYFAYFHLWPPHDPYATRRDFIDIFDDGWSPEPKPEHFFTKGQSPAELNRQRRMYDEYIAYVDAEFGRLFEALERSDVLKNTYLILTSDHGEMFERGINGHITRTLYEPVIHIPLMIIKPGQEERQDIYTPTSCTDLLPSLLRALGKPVPDWIEGQYLPTFADGANPVEREIFVVEALSNPKIGPLRKATVAMIRGRYKLIHYFGYEGYHDQYELYDLENDPEERENLYPLRTDLADELSQVLVTKLDEINR